MEAVLYHAVLDRIVEYVNDMQGCKATELAARAANLGLTGRTAVDAIDDLVLSGRLVEVEYTLPDMPDRVKSFLLPGGTQVRMRVDG